MGQSSQGQLLLLVLLRFSAINSYSSSTIAITTTIAIISIRSFAASGCRARDLRQAFKGQAV